MNVSLPLTTPTASAAALGRFAAHLDIAVAIEVEKVAMHENGSVRLLIGGDQPAKGEALAYGVYVRCTDHTSRWVDNVPVDTWEGKAARKALAIAADCIAYFGARKGEK